jgi:hypothetical protein
MDHPPIIGNESPLQPAPPGSADERSRSAIEMARVFTRSWGPFLGFLASIVALSFLSLQLARTDTIAVVIGVITVVTLIVAFFSHIKQPT